MDNEFDSKLTPATLALLAAHEARQREIGQLQATVATLECEQIRAARPLIAALAHDLGLAVGDRIRVANADFELGQYRITDFEANGRAPFVTLISDELLPDGRIGGRHYSWVIGLANSVKIVKMEEPGAV